MTMTCTQCGNKIHPEWSMYQDWLKMMNFIEFLFYEGYIQVKTYEEMQDCMMHFKKAATEADYEEIKKEIMEDIERENLNEIDINQFEEDNKERIKWELLASSDKGISFADIEHLCDFINSHPAHIVIARLITEIRKLNKEIDNIYGMTYHI